MFSFKNMTLTITKEMKQIMMLVLLYKCLLEYSFWKILIVEYNIYTFDFSYLKYCNGIFWCVLAFVLLDCKRKRASTFFLFFIYVLQIIPITVVYGMISLTSPFYYNFLLVSFVVCEVVIKYTKPVSFFKNNNLISTLILPFFFIVSLFVLVVIFIQNGLPSLDALDIYSVYILRRENPLRTDRFLGFLLSATVTVFLPILIVYFALKRKYILTIISAAGIFLIYLYSGHKTFLFSVFLCLIGVYYANKQNCFHLFFKAILSFFSILCGLTSIWPAYEQFFIFVYDLLIRRVMIVPAVLKFYHFDYFNSHPFLVFYGAIPKSINPYIPDYYDNGIVYTFEIGGIYFNSPLMSADTGFFAEVFSRFGYLGFFIFIIILSFILIQIDVFQCRNSYKVAISFFLYPIYALTERPVIGSLFFGTWFFLLLLISFFYERGVSGQQIDSSA